MAGHLLRYPFALYLCEEGQYPRIRLLFCGSAEISKTKQIDRVKDIRVKPMIKHRGFPGRMPGTDYQFIIRRANPKGVTPLSARERYRDRKPADKRADAAFMAALWLHFGNEPFERGNLDAGRLNWLFGREVLPAEDPFDPADYDALLMIDETAARSAFPEAFENVEF